VLLSSALFAQDDVDLNKIVVTPYRYGESLAKTAADVSVITEEDIEESNAQSVVDVLRPIAGVIVKDWYGNGTKAAVDIGGFGEQAALNVLVLVDGRRVNNVDLSGVDWSQIPIDQVERIEVVRGGAGAVLYGDNASSGVINIITKKGSGKSKFNLEAEYGSYSMNKEKLSLGGGIDNKFSYWLSGGWESTNGYRKNSYNKAKDFSSKFAYDFTDILSAHFDSGFHFSSYGMPGALWQNNIDEHNRRYARYGDDHANGKDYYFVMGPKCNFGLAGEFDIDFSYRVKDTDSYFFSSYVKQNNTIETFGITPKYILNHSIFDRKNKIITGVDFYRSLYSSKGYISSTDQLNTYSNISKNSIGGYLQDEFLITNEIALIAGYRYELERYTFAYHDNGLNSSANPDIDNKIKPSISAFNSGLTYTYKDNSNIFFNIGRSFRFPEVDEFTYYYTDPATLTSTQQLNTGLKPQSSLDYQFGVRHELSDKIKGSLSLYRKNVKNELYYNAEDTFIWGNYWSGRNSNYDKTIHEGFDFSIDGNFTKRVGWFGNYTFTNAYFDGGQYSGNEIPMVPKHKGSIGLKFTLPMHLSLNIIGTYVGPRYYLNDQANAYSKLNGYMVADTNISWQRKDFKVTFGINNLFGKQYSEYAGVNVDSGSKFYYPNSGRNFILKANYTF
jgi:iron complex outermembrane receptor protein